MTTLYIDEAVKAEDMTNAHTASSFNAIQN